jgi:NADPH2:quinone reductase
MTGRDEITGWKVGTDQRVAALTKIGSWAQRMLLEVGDLVPVPDGVSAEDAETVIVNGLTAWRVLHRTIRPEPGQTIVVFAAAGGVGSILVQLARDRAGQLPRRWLRSWLMPGAVTRPQPPAPPAPVT